MARKSSRGNETGSRLRDILERLDGLDRLSYGKFSIKGRVQIYSRKSKVFDSGRKSSLDVELTSCSRTDTHGRCYKIRVGGKSMVVSSVGRWTLCQSDEKVSQVYLRAPILGQVYLDGSLLEKDYNEIVII